MRTMIPMVVVAITLVSLNAYAANEAIKISDAWAWPTARSSRVGGIYLTIKNTGAEDDVLVGITTNAAENVQLRKVTSVDVPQFLDLKDGLKIPAGKTVRLSPTGTHVALKGLTGQMQKGQKIDLRLEFKKAGTVEVTAVVKPPGYIPQD